MMRGDKGTDPRLAGRQALGKRGEDAGAAWLESRGLQIIARNYRCRLGELDLIALSGDSLVFVEIRSRSRSDLGLPAESVGYGKQRKLRQAAACYLRQTGGEAMPCRFDVLGLLYDRPGAEPQIEWIQNAF